MKGKNKFKDILILILSITVILTVFGFIFISGKYNKVKNTKEKYEVKITKVIKGTTINGSNNNFKTDYEITDNNKTASFKFNLSDPKDSAAYTIIIKNTGTLSAQIDNIIERTNYNKDLINIKYTDVVGNVVEPNDEVTIELSLTSANPEIIGKDAIYELTILTSNIK